MKTIKNPPAPAYGPSNPSPREKAGAKVQTFGGMVELKPEMEKRYRELHADVWPEVKKALRKAHIRNYHIYVIELEEKRYLISHFEYTGSDPVKDFAGIAKDPTTRDRWWPLTDACQTRIKGTPAGQQWKPLEQVMFLK